MEIVDVNFVRGDAATVVVAFAVAKATFCATAGKPGCKDLGVMLTSFGIFARVERRAAELGCPYHECLVEHSTRFEIAQQAAIGWSTFLASGTCAFMSPCESQLPDAPVSINSINRTPRSINRRAIRHCHAKPLVLPRGRP